MTCLCFCANGCDSNPMADPGVWLPCHCWCHDRHTEAHGICAHCRNPAHRYPYGWDHVNRGMYACPTLKPVATCCDAHRCDAIQEDPEGIGEPIRCDLGGGHAGLHDVVTDKHRYQREEMP